MIRRVNSEESKHEKALIFDQIFIRELIIIRYQEINLSTSMCHFSRTMFALTGFLRNLDKPIRSSQ